MHVYTMNLFLVRWTGRRYQIKRVRCARSVIWALVRRRAAGGAAPEVVAGDRMLPHLHPTDLIRRQQPRTRSQGVPLHRPLHSYHYTIMHRLSFSTVLRTKPYGHERSFSIKCSMLPDSLSLYDAWKRALTALRQKVQFNKKYLQ